MTLWAEDERLKPTVELEPYSSAMMFDNREKSGRVREWKPLRDLEWKNKSGSRRVGLSKFRVWILASPSTECPSWNRSRQCWVKNLPYLVISFIQHDEQFVNAFLDSWPEPHTMTCPQNELSTQHTQ